MKLKYIFTALVAALTFVVGCEDDIETHLEGLRVSSSYIALPAEGGTQTITVRARYAWSFSDLPEWLEVTPDSGFSGETVVTFKAGTAASTQSAQLYINSKNESQLINVLQMTEKVELPITSCGEFNDKGEDGKSYRVKGTVTKIVNTEYGNMYISDGTGDAYIYGTLDAEGGKKNFLSLGIEVGDIVTVEGPRKTYSGTIELVDVSVISIEKSLIKVDSLTVKSPNTEEFVRYTEPLALEGGVVKAYLTCKGTSLSVNVPAAVQSWLSVTSIETSDNSGVVTFSVAANSLGDRTADLTFNTVSGGKTNTAQTSLEQKGAIIETTIDKLLAAEDGATQYRTTGYITNDKGSEYGNIYIKDATGEIYVYGVLDSKGQTKQWKNMGIKEGDIVTVVGPKTSHNGTAQLKNVAIENHIKVQDISLADFRALKDDKTAYYRISGKVAKSTEANTKFDLKDYGNFALTDGTTEVYVYGVRTGWGGAKKQFGTLNIKEGDELTIVCYKTSFNGLIEADGCFYVSHKSGSVEPEDPQPGVDPYTIDLKYTLGTNAYDDFVATINGKENVKALKFGASKGRVGDITITVPAGSKRVSFYAIAWKGAATTLEFSGLGTTFGTQAIKANDGVAGNGPYTITVTDADYYTFTVPTALAEDLDIKITTAASAGNNTRAVLFGIKAFKE